MIKVTATDAAGNLGTSGMINVELDNIAPVITIGLSTPTQSILITVMSSESL